MVILKFDFLKYFSQIRNNCGNVKLTWRKELITAIYIYFLTQLNKL